MYDRECTQTPHNQKQKKEWTQIQNGKTIKPVLRTQSTQPQTEMQTMNGNQRRWKRGTTMCSARLRFRESERTLTELSLNAFYLCGTSIVIFKILQEYFYPVEKHPKALLAWIQTGSLFPATTIMIILQPKWRKKNYQIPDSNFYNSIIVGFSCVSICYAAL